MFSKRNKIIIYTLFGIFVFCFLLSIFTKRRVSESKAYYDRDDIALYIYKYEKLPINFITKDSKDNDYYKGNKSNCYENGYNVGGDTFRYEGSITNYTNSKYLKECDYYPNRQEVIDNNNRGSYRLVYDVYNGVEIYYTEDHYNTFTKLTKFSLNATSNVCKIISFTFLAGDAVYVFLLFKPKYIKQKEDFVEAEVID